MRRARGFWWIVPALILAMAAGFVVWGMTAPGPMPQAEAALTSNPRVTVDIGKWMVFGPADRQPNVGLVFYPGGRVQPRSYAPAAWDIASRGYLVVIVPMPLNLAVLAPDAAGEVIAAFPTVRAWAVGGHSLGGAMAARFAHTHPGAVRGLVLWAAYPAAGNSLAASGLAVVSVSASRDGLSTPAKIDASRPHLPPDTRWRAIEGGNHAQFGWYGEQDGDQAATISRESQQEQAVEATFELLAVLQRSIP